MRTSVRVRALMLAAIVALMGTHVQGSGGSFLFASDIGHAEHIGYVARGATIEVELIAINTNNLNLTCLLTTTLFMVRENNSSQTKKKVFRKNATRSALSLRAPWGGEAFLVVQTQRKSASCAGVADMFVDNSTTTVLAQTRDNRSVEKEADEVTADEPIPAEATDPRLIEWFERHNR